MIISKGDRSGEVEGGSWLAFNTPSVAQQRPLVTGSAHAPFTLES